MTTKWAGIIPAVWTPTDLAGNLMEAELRENMAFMVERGAHGFLALGSTGEFPLLEPATRKRALEIIIEAAGGLPVMANVSDVRPRIVAELGQHAKRSGAAAITVLPPYFFSTSQADLVEFFARAAEAAGLPMFLYNFPERAGTRIELETIKAVIQRAPVAGVKQSGGDFDYHQPLIELAREEKIVVLTGTDTRLAETLMLGVQGTVSGMANAVPELLVEIFRSFELGKLDQSALSSQRMTRLGELMDQVCFPGNVAALMAARSRHIGKPKQIFSDETRRSCESLTFNFRRLFSEWKLM